MLGCHTVHTSITHHIWLFLQSDRCVHQKKTPFFHTVIKKIQILTECSDICDTLILIELLAILRMSWRENLLPAVLHVFQERTQRDREWICIVSYDLLRSRPRQPWNFYLFTCIASIRSPYFHTFVSVLAESWNWDRRLTPSSRLLGTGSFFQPCQYIIKCQIYPTLKVPLILLFDSLS